MTMTPLYNAYVQRTADTGLSAWRDYRGYWFSAGVPAIRSN